MTEADTGAPADNGASEAENLAGNILEGFGTKPEEKENTTQEAPKTEDKPDEKPKDEKQHTVVSHAALHEERERRKEIQRQYADEKARNDKIEERQSKLLEVLAGKNQAEPEYIDPITKLEKKVEEVDSTIAAAKKEADEEKKRFDEETNLVNRYKGSLNAFMKDVPDVLDARQFLLESKTSELRALGYDDGEIDKIIKEEERGIVQRAYKNEKNPGELLMQAAKARGYAKGEAKPDAKEETKIQQIDKGLKASKSLGSGGTSPRASNDLDAVSAGELADMTDEEFKAFFTKIERTAKKSA